MQIRHYSNSFLSSLSFSIFFIVDLERDQRIHGIVYDLLRVYRLARVPRVGRNGCRPRYATETILENDHFRETIESHRRDVCILARDPLVFRPVRPRVTTLTRDRALLPA